MSLVGKPTSGRDIFDITPPLTTVPAPAPKAVVASPGFAARLLASYGTLQRAAGGSLKAISEETRAILNAGLQSGEYTAYRLHDSREGIGSSGPRIAFCKTSQGERPTAFFIKIPSDLAGPQTYGPLPLAAE